jgi:hypothetical protein
MRLDHRQVRFVTPFGLTLRRPNHIRLGGSRGHLDLQETAVVAEGELMRFSFLGTEWLFRRALSEWTTVTVPYGRITSVRYDRLVALRIVSILLVAVVAAFSATLLLAEGDPTTGWTMAGFAAILALLFGVLNLWMKPSYQVRYRGKDGRTYLLAFTVRAKRLRKPFLDTLAAHQAAAAPHAVRPA